MFIPILISLLIKSINAAQRWITINVHNLPIPITVRVTQDGTTLWNQDCTPNYNKVDTILIYTTSLVTVRISTSVCDESTQYDFSSGSSSQIDISGSDIPDKCYPRSVVVNIDSSIPSVFQFGYKINGAGIMTTVTGNKIEKTNLKSADTLYLYLIKSPLCSTNVLLQTYEAKTTGYTYSFALSQIPERCYAYEVRVTFDSIPSHYTFGYKKTGDANIQEIIEDTLHLPNLDESTRVTIYVKSPSCEEFELVRTFTAEIVSSNTIREADIPSKCTTYYYLSFDLSDLEDVSEDMTISYTEAGKSIIITDGYLIKKQTSFSITPKFKSQRSNCYEKNLPTFEAELGNDQNIVKITKEMLKESGLSDWCIYPKRYLNIIQDFKDEYISICMKMEDSEDYSCQSDGSKVIEYYGPQKTYQLFYRSGYCGTKTPDDYYICYFKDSDGSSCYKFLENVTSNKNINMATFKYTQDDILDSECKTRYQIFIWISEGITFEYTLPDGVEETIKTTNKIIFTGKDYFDIKFKVHHAICKIDYEVFRSVYHPSEEYSYYKFPPPQSIFESCLIPMDDSLSPGEIAGIVIGCLVFVAVIVIIVVIIIRKRRNQAHSSENQDANADEV